MKLIIKFPMAISIEWPFPKWQGKYKRGIQSVLSKLLITFKVAYS